MFPISPEQRRLLDADDDGDGLTNAEEFVFGSNAQEVDADRDGLWDGDERRFGTDPNEYTGFVSMVASPVERAEYDDDGDRLTNAEENAFGSNPNEVDADRDGLWDGDERRLGTDPNDYNGYVRQNARPAEEPFEPIDVDTPAPSAEPPSWDADANSIPDSIQAPTAAQLAPADGAGFDEPAPFFAPEPEMSDAEPADWGGDASW